MKLNQNDLNGHQLSQKNRTDQPGFPALQAFLVKQHIYTGPE